jgi:hypothetical protein
LPNIHLVVIILITRPTSIHLAMREANHGPTLTPQDGNNVALERPPIRFEHNSVYHQVAAYDPCEIHAVDSPELVRRINEKLKTMDFAPVQGGALVKLDILEDERVRR